MILKGGIVNNMIFLTKNSSRNDKPIKVCFEHKEYKTKEVDVTEYERISFILKNMLWSKVITTQQYRSVRGQSKYGNNYDALKFIENKSYLELYNKLNKTKNVLIITENIPIQVFKDTKFGIVTLK